MNEMAILSGYLTIQEAAPIIGVSEAQVTRYCQDGTLPAVNLGKQWLIEDAVVRNFERPLRGNPAFRKDSKPRRKKS